PIARLTIIGVGSRGVSPPAEACAAAPAGGTRWVTYVSSYVAHVFYEANGAGDAGSHPFTTRRAPADARDLQRCLQPHRRDGVCAALRHQPRAATAGLHAMRQQFGLSAQLTMRASSTVSDASQRDTTKQPCFRPHGALVSDQRICSLPRRDHVSLLTLDG